MTTPMNPPPAPDRIVPALYVDDVDELLNRMEDDLGEIDPKTEISIRKHINNIMKENVNQQLGQ